MEALMIPTLIEYESLQTWSIDNKEKIYSHIHYIIPILKEDIPKMNHKLIFTKCKTIIKNNTPCEYEINIKQRHTSLDTTYIRGIIKNMVDGH